MNYTTVTALAEMIDFRSLALKAEADTTGQGDLREQATLLDATFTRLSSLRPLADEQIQLVQDTIDWYRDNGLDDIPLLDHLDTTLEHWHLPEGTSMENATLFAYDVIADHLGIPSEEMPPYVEIGDPRGTSIDAVERTPIPELFHIRYNNLRTRILRQLGNDIRLGRWHEALWDIDDAIEDLEELKEALEEQLPPLETDA